MQIESEFEQITILETIPGHPQVLADTIFPGALPGFDLEPTFAENFPDFILKGREFADGVCSNTPIVYVRVLQRSLQDCLLEVGGGAS